MALQGWNDKLAELWELLSQSPETFKGGDVWQVIVTIHNAMQGIGYGLLVLFFAIGIFQTAASFRDIQRPEYALRHLIRFIMAKVAVGSSMEIILAIFNICGGIIRTAMSGMGGIVGVSSSLPAELVTAIDEVGFLASIPLWMAAFLGFLIITVLSFILILTVYGRFFKIYLLAAMAPLPLASFAGEGTSAMGKAFIKSYIGVCMEGAVIVLACLIYTAFLSSGSPAVDPSLPDGIQYSSPHLPCERVGPNCKVDVWPVKNKSHGAIYFDKENRERGRALARPLICYRCFSHISRISSTLIRLACASQLACAIRSRWSHARKRRAQ